MEASALHAPSAPRRGIGNSLLRLRSDEQLIAAFRAGNEEAFATIHDRYRQRLFAYVRQMLPGGARADAEDVLQDVFVRAYGALRKNDHEIQLRAWLYRIAHNRCIDHLRRPMPPANEIYEISRTPLQDPIETAQRRDDLRRLVQDVGRLPEQQRSALLMREINGLSYTDIAAALDVTVAAVKSLLVRARVGLVEEIMARDTDCAEIRADLTDAYDRRVKASGRAKRHMRECQGCREYKTALRSMQRSFAALSPAVGFAPLALAAKTLGLGSGAGGGAAVAITGGKVCAAVVCTAALATGGAVEFHHLTATRVHKLPPAVRHTPSATRAPISHHSSPRAPAFVPAPIATATATWTQGPTGPTGGGGIVVGPQTPTPTPVETAEPDDPSVPTPTPTSTDTPAATASVATDDRVAVLTPAPTP
ncbi:MAG: hypothetical protein QOF76_1508 [Solirubrobacteraceae bacterium]|nr:hypothetical protein [Solirubrobacteraceae bacterium]